MIITQTPLRISFAGGGTDFPEFYREEPGCVVSSAIDKYVYVIVKERFDDQIYINYSRKEIVDRVDEIQHELVREAMRKTGVRKGVEITTLADIPSEGSGLGSSSSITVGLLHALYTYRGEMRTAETLAQEACEIEIERTGKPVGKQDQYIAAYGNTRFIEFRPDESVYTKKLDWVNHDKRRFSANLLLFYTNQPRKSVDILKEQTANTQGKRALLRNLRELAYEARECLQAGEFERMGEILHRGWVFKKQLASRISNPEIDQMYEQALQAGALGGKISGAGGGGFLLLYCPQETQERVRQALRAYRELPFLLERDGSKVIFNIRRYEWK